MKKNLITTILRSTSAFSLTFALGLTDKLQAQENPSPEESTEETTEHYYLDEYREEPITLLEAGGKMHTLTAYLHVYDGAVYATTAETSSEIITAIVVSQFQESEIKDALAYYRQFEGEGTTVTQGTLILGSDATRPSSSSKNLSTFLTRVKRKNLKTTPLKNIPKTHLTLKKQLP